MDKQDDRATAEPGDVRAGTHTAAPLSPPPPRSVTHGEVYLTVQRSAAFQEVRRRYRHFVVPATAVFLAWYLAYVLGATLVPGLMAHRVAGALNVAMLAGLGQFASTFLLTWAYARHARLRRDAVALDIRWRTQDLTGGNIR
ncbi:membrane protein [Streptomyces natalensis ATCC 27448]|uniref:Membrane protein n=1 Tax=Streptomyces natalensis ATCC 27448 TaxID=1240678 RepID=A0A0D7CEK8_9ACTN|nr:membrane protein [Streptomyces natalensis ATCC 27448]